MGEKTGISWTSRTQNFWKGCKKVSPGCKNCLHPDTPILYADWTWRPIRNVQVGDALIGFNERGKGLRKYTKSFVEAVQHTRKQSIRFKTEDTEIICSIDHPFLSAKAGNWITPEHFRIKDSVLRYVGQHPTYEFTTSYKAGYIASLTSGDGTMRWEPGWGSVWRGESPQCYWRVAVSDREILDRTQTYLKGFGIDLEIKPFDGGGKEHYLPMMKLETRVQNELEIIHKLIRQEANEDFARGWLAGFFDAEGSNGYYRKLSSLRLFNTNPDLLEKAVQYGKLLNIDLRLEADFKCCKSVRFYGTLEERGKFLGTIRPALQRKVDGILGAHAGFKHSPVKLIESVGEQDLIDIQTSSKTFYAAGLATHNCYMFREMNQYGMDPTEITRTKTWLNPRKWNKEAEANGEPQLVFTCSWSDFFIEEADEWRDDAWAVIKSTPWLQWQVLTKRIKRVEKHLPEDWGDGYPNVWLGTSIESNTYSWRADVLRNIPAKIRFISAEPLLGPLTDLNLKDIHWLIAGGESGPDFRPMDKAWAIDLRDKCKAAGTAFFFKQSANLRPGIDPLLDGVAYEEYPKFEAPAGAKPGRKKKELPVVERHY